MYINVTSFVCAVLLGFFKIFTVKLKNAIISLVKFCFKESKPTRGPWAILLTWETFLTQKQPCTKPWFGFKEKIKITISLLERAYGPCELNKPFHLTTVSLLLKVHKNNNYKISYVSTPSKSLLIYNLTKVRPLFMLSHRGSDN